MYVYVCVWNVPRMTRVSEFKYWTAKLLFKTWKGSMKCLQRIGKDERHYGICVVNRAAVVMQPLNPSLRIVSCRGIDCRPDSASCSGFMRCLLQKRTTRRMSNMSARVVPLQPTSIIYTYIYICQWGSIDTCICNDICANVYDRFYICLIASRAEFTVHIEFFSA